MTTSERAAAYLAKLPCAISGSGGHARTFAAACRLVEFGLSVEQAAPVFAAWNETHCQPRWTDAELRHKLTDAYRHSLPQHRFAASGGAGWSPLPLPTFRRPSLPALRIGTRLELSR